MAYEEILNANGNLQAILTRYSPITFNIIKQHIDTTKDGYRFERDIELKGDQIFVRAHSQITTKYKALEIDSIGKFLEKKKVDFELLATNWVCKDCAYSVDIQCDHISYDPYLIRCYKLEAEGFKSYITESFITLPF